MSDQNLELELRLEWVTSVEDSITVIGIRAGEQVPVTKRNMDRDEIDKFSYGQDVPQQLAHTPSMNWYSDSGIGSNYSYFSMRGIQQTRISMTLDGAPLNDPAEHALFFNNFHDFLSSIDSIQIQRGVGTSSVGSPAFGGSVNFASSQPARDSRGEARLVLGSFGTTRASVGYESGLFNNGFHVSGRFSYANTDGDRERSGSEHHTLFLNAGWQGERSALTFVAFSGQEQSQLAYLAVDPETLSENRRFNPLTEEDRDNFGQDFAQVKYMRELGSETVLTASFYYNGAAGWFQLWGRSRGAKRLAAIRNRSGVLRQHGHRQHPSRQSDSHGGCALQRFQRRPLSGQRRCRTGLQEHRIQEDGERLWEAGVPAGSGRSCSVTCTGAGRISRMKGMSI